MTAAALIIGAVLLWRAGRIQRSIRKVASNDLSHIDSKLDRQHDAVMGEPHVIGKRLEKHVRDPQAHRAPRRPRQAA